MLPTTVAAGDGGSAEPHGAMLLVLGYLRLRELLACGRVCRGLRDAVAGDPLLWQRVAVEPPLSYRLTDDALLEVAARAEGRLRSLALIECRRVSDAGLLRVVERNPCISELYVPGCTSLSADGMVKVVQLLHEHSRNLNRLRLHGLCNITKDHLDVLNSLLCKGNLQQDGQPFFYNHTPGKMLNTDDERPIDVDVCPRCTSVRLVFDCTRDNCRKVKHSWPQCRGCFFCIPRCERCGGCIDLEELGETELACSDLLCMNCWLKLPKCSRCNRPYCPKHANLATPLSPSGQFICQQCTEVDISLNSQEAGY